jgi:thiamine pyrophosphate-dependent acetolactate synthase large subunit-like protein
MHSMLDYPPFAELARGFGLNGVTVRSADEILALAPILSDVKEPLLVDVRADPVVDILSYR